MGFCEVHIAPEPRRVIESLEGDLKLKVKNALREISLSQGIGTTIGLNHVESLPHESALNGASLRLYKAGRFRILFRRNTGRVWIEAFVLNSPNHFSSTTSGGHRP